MKNSLRTFATRIGSASLATAATASLLFVAAPTHTTQAATATATMSVSANIGGTCTVGGANVTFGTYTSTTASTATGSVQVTCSNGTSAVVSLNQGNNNNRASAFATRALNNGTNYLGYDVYTDNTYATVWNGTNTQPITSTGAPITLTAYGRIPSGQNPATGSYNDTVTITVSF